MKTPETLEEKVIFATYKISRYMRKEFGTIDHVNELTMIQITALIAIAHGQNTMGDIANELNITLPSATSLIERLVKGEYVKRVHNPHDKRVVQIELTEKGKELLKKGLENKVEKMKFMLSKLTEEERNMILSLLEKILISRHID